MDSVDEQSIRGHRGGFRRNPQAQVTLSWPSGEREIKHGPYAMPAAPMVAARTPTAPTAPMAPTPMPTAPHAPYAPLPPPTFGQWWQQPPPPPPPPPPASSFWCYCSNPPPPPSTAGPPTGGGVRILTPLLPTPPRPSAPLPPPTPPPPPRPTGESKDLWISFEPRPDQGYIIWDMVGAGAAATSAAGVRGAAGPPTLLFKSHMCDMCGKVGHTKATCWYVKPDLAPRGWQGNEMHRGRLLKLHHGEMLSAQDRVLHRLQANAIERRQRQWQSKKKSLRLL